MSIQIKGLNGLTVAELHNELIAGGRFVTYQYCISILFMTFRPPSSVYFVRSGQGTILQSLPYTIITFLFGWWGFPWGAVYTIDTLINNFQGGKDVTELVVESLTAQQPVASKHSFSILT